MTEKTETLRYQLDFFMKYKDKNNQVPPDLKEYFNTEKNIIKPNITNYSEQMKTIVSAITRGDDANDVIFKINVKYYVNKMNCNNYHDIIKKLLDLDYSCVENIQYLAHELIICAMRCPIAIKGLQKERQINSKALSEISVEVIKIFCQNKTTETNNGISFQDELLKLCRKFFMDFVNITQSMDENNENTSENYKGFMSLLGLMYLNGLISSKIIIDCIDSLKRTIFCSKVSKKSEQINNSTTEHHEKMFGYKKNFNRDLYEHLIYFDTDSEILENEPDRYICYRNLIECTNYYKGYEHLMYNVINYFNNKLKNMEKIDNSSVTEQENKTTEISKINLTEKLCNTVSNFIDTHKEISNLNNKYLLKNKGNLIHPLKPHVMIFHDEITQNLKNIEKKLCVVNKNSA